MSSQPEYGTAVHAGDSSRSRQPATRKRLGFLLLLVGAALCLSACGCSKVSGERAGAQADAIAPTLNGSITIAGLTSTSYGFTAAAGSDNVSVTSYRWRVNGGPATEIAAGGLSGSMSGRTPGSIDTLEMAAGDAAGNWSPWLAQSVTLLSMPGTPSWVAAIGNIWTEIPASPVFKTWVGANLAPNSGYTGYDPVGSIRDAYTNPIFDPVTKKFAMQGGGHGGGNANAVITFDANTLAYAIPLQPNLDPLVARPATHMYQAASFHAGILSIHYNTVGNADTNSGFWTYLNANPYGPQLLAMGAAYGDGYLQQGTKCVYDPLLDKDWVTNVPGDIGDNARGHLLLVDRATHHIDAAIGASAFSWSSLCLAGDHMYVFSLVQGDPRQHLVTRVHRTTQAREFITCVGLGMPGFGSTQETLMSFFDGTRIRFWNPGVAADRDAFYALDLTPIGSHAGTSADPLQMSVSREQRGVSALPPLTWTYTLDYIPEWGVAMMLPSSSTRWWAIKL